MKDINEIIKKIDFYKEEIIAFTQNLIKINSVNGNETEVCKLIKEKLSEHGIKSKLVGNDKKRLNLIAKIEGRKHSKTLMLNGHTDTVPFGDLSKWKYKPLSGKFVDGKIYGRGSYDMKGGIASIVFAAIALKESQIKLGGNLILAFSADEESGNHTGIRYLVKKGIKPTACIVAEPMSKKAIRIGSRGMYRFEIITKGKTAHTGSTSKKGINAVIKMAKILLALQKMKPRYIKYKLFPPPKITPGTIINGGIAINIVPDSCRALVDCRLSYGQTKKTILSDIRRELKRLKEKDKKLSFSIRELSYVPPAIINKNHRLVKISSKNIRKILGFEPSLKISGGVTDGNILVKAGIPTIIFGPEGDHAHSENEFVKVESIINISKVFALTAIDW
jgi:succinyl-diaminopimelate desuccinylase